MNDLRWNILEISNAADRRQRRLESRNQRLQSRDPFKYMSESGFVKTYRLSKAMAGNLIAEVSPFMRRQRRSDGMSIAIKVLIALAFYATGSYQTIVGQSSSHQVSQPTVSRVLWQVTRALNTPQVFKKHVRFPLTRQRRDAIKHGFYRKYKLPGIIGAIDGTHVAIIRPHIQEDKYFNRKGYHSLNVMIICDSDLNILCLDPSKPGKMHDNMIWREHPLHRYLNEKYDEEQISLLGDSGYALRRIMMTPTLNSQPGTPEAHYYELHVSARNVVERCIGVLKARFRCLLVARVLHYDPVFAGKIVNACAVLHNIANGARLSVPQLTQQQQRVEHQLQVRRVATERAWRNSVQPAADNNSRRTNRELLDGRAAQTALINRLWAERDQIQE